MPAASSTSTVSSAGALPSSSATTRATGSSRRASNAAGLPLRRRPSTAMQCASVSSTPTPSEGRVVRREPGAREDGGDDPEAHDDLRLGPGLELEVVV